MKFAVLNSDTLQNNVSSGETNVGAIYMTRSVMNLYSELGVSEDEIVEIKTCEVEKYDGEEVILPICIHVPKFHENNAIFKASPKIKPVFLAISMTETLLSEKQIQTLKANEPVACRDEHTLDVMQKHGIKAFLLGCLVATLSNNKHNEKADKILFSDVPLFAREYIPETIKKDIVFIKQERSLHELPEGVSPSEYADMIMSLYREKARLVVTSRFHGAALAIAYDIPYILINEAYTYRFSWLKGIGNFYTRENISTANWNPETVDFSAQKRLMKQIAKSRMLDAVNEIDKSNPVLLNRKSLRLSSQEFQNATDKLCDLLYYDKWKNVGLIDYYDGAIEFINRYWNKNDRIRYAFWGVNNNAEAIHKYMTDNFTNSELVKIYDAKQAVNFHGIASKKPETIARDENIIVFVTTFVAKTEAENLFKEKELPNNSYYLCDREYISENNF